MSRYNFNEFLTHYDAHVYFVKDTESEQRALDLHQTVRTLFPQLPIFPPCRDPVGPHPVGMWECHIPSPEEFS
jgi:aromatic ring-cleaving dioxygenase